MFLVNGEILSKKEHPEEYGWMQRKLTEIRKEGKKTLVFKAFSKSTMQTDESGKKRKSPRARVISAETTFPFSPTDSDDDAVFQTWSYFPHQNALKNDAGVRSLRNKGMRLYQSNVYSLDRKDDIEQVFYLRYISQNRFVTEVDDERDNRIKAEKIMNETEAKNLVYSNKSPIHPDVIGTEDAVRNIASTWGIAGIDGLSFSEIQNQLWDRIELSQYRYGQTKRGYKEFVEEALKMGDGSKRTTVILGIQKGVLKCEDDFWYLTTKGGAKQPLKAVLGGKHQQDEEIMRFLLNDDIAFEMVELAVQNGDNTVITEALKDRTIQDLRKQAIGELGYPPIVINKKSKKDVQDIIDSGKKYEKK